MTQADLIMEYFLAHPNKDIEHPSVVDWAVSEWKSRTGEVFRDPDRAIRKLHADGKLQKIGKGVYRYDPDYVANPKGADFSEAQKREILKRGNYKCAVCGKGKNEGVELHVDHIKPKDKGGDATLENGQVLCGEHNYQKKNYNQTETAKNLFVNLHRQAQAIGDTRLKDFAANILRVYKAHDINGHIDWDEE